MPDRRNVRTETCLVQATLRPCSSQWVEAACDLQLEPLDTRLTSESEQEFLVPDTWHIRPLYTE